MTTIRVEDHVEAPGGRYIKDGPGSGEEFRNNVLVPALREAIEHGEPLNVILDGTAGYGSSFLEEAFGGLIRDRYFTASEVRSTLHVLAIAALYAPYKRLSDKYISDAQPSVQINAA